MDFTVVLLSSCFDCWRESSLILNEIVVISDVEILKFVAAPLRFAALPDSLVRTTEGILVHHFCIPRSFWCGVCMRLFGWAYSCRKFVKNDFLFRVFAFEWTCLVQYASKDFEETCSAYLWIQSFFIPSYPACSSQLPLCVSRNTTIEVPSQKNMSFSCLLGGGQLEEQ